MRRAWRQGRFLSLLAIGALGAGCVESFQGSWIEFELRSGRHVPDDALSGLPPTGTHYEFWVVTEGNAFYLESFQVVAQIERAHPCFIEDDDSAITFRGITVRGLHSTRIYDKIVAEAMDPASQMGATVTDEEAGYIADAQERITEQLAIEEELQGVVSHDPRLRPADLTALEAAVPDFMLIDQPSNELRRTACQDFYKRFPDTHVGNDKVFSLPLNGVWYGIVEGVDPRNNAFVGGAGFSVPSTFKTFDQFWMRWQFNDPADPRMADFGGPSPTGYPYMNGAPEFRVRRVINVSMTSEQFGFINGEIAIYPGIDEDNVHF